MSLQIKKRKDNIKCGDYLCFIRSLPCAICSALRVVQVFRTTPSHTVSVGRAGSSDLRAVNACLTHHPQSTQEAVKIFEQNGIIIEEHIEKLQAAYIRDRGIKLGKKTLEVYLIECGLAEMNDGSKRKNRKEFEHYKIPF